MHYTYRYTKKSIILICTIVTLSSFHSINLHAKIRFFSSFFAKEYPPVKAINTDENFQAKDRFILTIKGGSLKIQESIDQKIHISGLIGENIIKTKWIRNGRTLTLILQTKEREEDIQAILSIKIPKNSNISINRVSANAHILVDLNEIELNTVSGDTDFANQARSLDINTVSGDIDGIIQSPKSEINTVSGDIMLTGLSGSLKANSVSGEIHIEGKVFNSVEMVSVSGEQTLISDKLENGPYSFASMSGDVELNLAKQQSLNVDFEAMSGHLKNAFPSKENAVDIDIATMSGDATITKKVH